MLRAEIAALSDGLHEQTLHPEAADLGLDPAQFRDIEVVLRLDVAGARVLAAFDVSAVATLECDRTLKPYDQPVRGSHTILFVPPEQVPPDADEEDDLAPLPADATSIDLTAAVRDTLLLALPLRRVSPEAEDAEIPSVFGADLDDDGTPIDDRWAALRRLRDDS
jgi:uncharacterized protein